MHPNYPPTRIRPSLSLRGAGAALVSLALIACGDQPPNMFQDLPVEGNAGTTGEPLPSTSSTAAPTTTGGAAATTTPAGPATPIDAGGTAVTTGPPPSGSETQDAAPGAGDVPGAPDGAVETPVADGGNVPDADTEPPPREDLGVGDGSDVITIGDSWMTMYGGGIEGGLDRLDTDYRHYGVAGTRFLNGVIPRQYDSAKRRNPNIATVIMTGGGNDILLGGYDCDTAESCLEYVTDLTAGLDELWTKMSNDGVTDVIYINYARDAGSSPEEARPDELPKAKICAAGPIRCHSVETTDLVMGQLPDGIHPSGAAHDRIAAFVHDLMEEKGMRR